MRTTLTVDEEINEQLTRTARETGQSYKFVVNLALRRGLQELNPAVAPFDYQPHAGQLRAGIDPRGFNELAGKLDDELYFEKHAGR